ncbi:hypothetical protein [Nocardia transvalensis]|uniref:hypothetical protein n=1 Tax=Nocardia transvalensis TaxID=37333 RepID=UPI0018947EE1|nr:hypothetical protein [Nocardia transvalensis]MBF6333599.1 hypothetical protein [Nocardia transvalensis]
MGSRVSSAKSCLPGWWFVSYVFVFAMFIIVAGVLISHDVAPMVALSIPVGASAAAIVALRWLCVIGTSIQPAPAAMPQRS